jgi:predicted PolB exonuclease-like 3'-5' exonuclease
MKPHYTNTNNPVDFPKMNERIRELAEQAEDWADSQNFYESDYKDYFNEKFAELIVRACAKTIEAQDVDPSFKLRMSWAIKTQFGVEQ